MDLDQERFLRAVERRRAEDQVSWRELSRRLNLSASTLSRLARGRRPDLDTFLRLLDWLGQPAERFLVAPNIDPRRADTLSEVARLLDEDTTLAAEDARAINEIVQHAYRRLRLQ